MKTVVRTYRWFKFPAEPTLFKNFKPTKHCRLCPLRENLLRLRSGPEKMTALRYTGAKIKLKEDVPASIIPSKPREVVLLPSIRRTQAATRRRLPRSTSDRSELTPICPSIRGNSPHKFAQLNQTQSNVGDKRLLYCAYNLHNGL